MQWTFAGSLISATLFLGAVPVSAEVCDYRLSSLIGSLGAGGTMVGTATVASSSALMQATGIYLIPNFTTGAIMLGSVGAGASAAGTAGILSGTATGIGATVAAVSAPVTVTVAALATLAGLGFEGGCYFSDERITDFPTVYKLVKQVVANGKATDIGLVFEPEGPWLWMRNADESISTYQVLDLDIVNGELIHRDWGPNSSLGKIAVKLQAQ